MRDEHLKQLLEELPRHKASDGFTARAVRQARMSRPDTPRRHFFHGATRTALATAAATLAVAAGSVYLTLEHREREDLASLQSQHRQLAAEISALREEAGFDPVIELGEDDGVEYVLDLRPVADPASRTAQELSAGLQ